MLALISSVRWVASTVAESTTVYPFTDASSLSEASIQVAGRPNVGSVVCTPGSVTCLPVGSITMNWPYQTLPLPESTSLILMT